MSNVYPNYHFFYISNSRNYNLKINLIIFLFINCLIMIWLRLKLDLLPIIAQEVDRVAKEYMRK